MFLDIMDGLKAGVAALGGKLAATATLNESRQKVSCGIFKATEAVAAE